jgi:predicted RNase H-like nuclease (RuvC/YqgF family)
LKECLKDADSDREQVMASESIGAGWKWFKTQEHVFKLEGDYDKTTVRKWTNEKYKCEWVDYLEGKKSVSVKLKGRWFRGLYGEVTMYTERRRAMAKEIVELKSKIEDKKKELDIAKEEADSCRDKHKQYQEEIRSLKAFIHDINKNNEDLACNTMTLGQAHNRIQKLLAEN